MAKTAGILYLVLLACLPATFASRKRVDNVELQMSNMMELADEILKLVDLAEEDAEATVRLQLLANKFDYYLQDVLYCYNIAVIGARNDDAKKMLTKLTDLGAMEIYEVGKHANSNATLIKKAFTFTYEHFKELILMPKRIDRLLKKDQNKFSLYYSRTGYDIVFFGYYLVRDALIHQKHSTGEISAELANSFNKLSNLLTSPPRSNSSELEECANYIHTTCFFTDRLVFNIDTWLRISNKNNPISEPIFGLPFTLKSLVGDLRKHVQSSATVTELYARFDEFLSAIFVELEKLPENPRGNVSHWKKLRREVILEALSIFNTMIKLFELINLK